LPSKKTLAAILAIVIVVLIIVDYQQYHLDTLMPSVRFDFQFVSPFAPDLTLPVLASVTQREQTENFTPPKPSSSIKLTSTPSGNSQPVAVSELGVYGGDPSSNTSQPLSAIDWSANGPIVPGQRVNSTRLYLRNEGTMPFTLVFSTLDWSFENADGKPLLADYSGYFALTWDYDNSSIAMNETKAISFSLMVSPSLTDVSRFSFNLVITSIY